MHVTILGAGGRTGRLVVELALAEDHEVVASVRDTAKLGELASRVAVVEGDVADEAAVARTVAGADAVVSALGPVKGGPPDLMRRAAANVVSAMQASGVRRLVWLTGAGVVAPGDPPSRIRSLVRGVMRLSGGSRRALEDSDAAFAEIAASGLDWTVVRVPRLADGQAKGGVKVVEEPPGYVAVTRADVATFLLGQLSDTTYIRRAPFVIY